MADSGYPGAMERTESAQSETRTTSESIFSRSESALTNVSEAPSVQQAFLDGYVRVSAGLYLHESKPGLQVSAKCL
jgi:hypothetical protein